MVSDPYKVLGISSQATPEEIKSAYRKMAKLYHPDLHPNDPNAAVKMNEVNEAYDMLTHPEKYAKRRAEEEARRNYYGGYQSQGYNRYSGGYGGYRNGSQGSGSGSNGQNGYRGTGGWYSDFGGFDFDDIFGFGRFYTGGQSNASLNPEAEASDSPEIRSVVNKINSGDYEEAVRILMQIQHYGRNARWYYLYAIALYGYGDTAGAADYMTKAVQLDPNNSKYHSILQRFRSEGQTYYQSTSSIVNPFRRIGRIILIFIIIRFLFRILLLMSGFGMYYP